MADALPKMVPVKSSNIEAIGHDPKANELHVKFKDGGHYIYADAAADHHNSMLNAESVGSYFHAHIKGKFKHRKH